MTLYMVYKDICRLTKCEKIYKSHELKECKIGDRLIVSLKSYDRSEIENEFKYISDIYFKLIASINRNIIDDKIESLGFHTYHKNPKLKIDMNTIISVIYINKKGNDNTTEGILLDTLKVLFK